MKWIFTWSAIALITASCRPSRETMNTATPLFETKWTLKKIYDDNTEQAVNTKAFIRFDKEKGTAGGNGSCNSFGSNATVVGSQVSFKNIFSTKMYCDQVQQVENKYFKQLQTADRFEIKRQSLFLYHDKQLLLEFLAE